MARQGARASTSGRETLLTRAIAYLASHGVAEMTLRGLAAELGTSHRMLIYHFGSRDGLLVEVVRALEAQQLAALSELRLDPSASPVEIARRMWAQLSDPALAPYERLFFELYGQALQGRPFAVPMLDGIVTSWLSPLTDFLIADGVPPDVARPRARASLALTRGLLLDLLATGDRDGVNEAMEEMLADYSRRELDPERE
jgi:AcrR family transcriptional regulator